MFFRGSLTKSTTLPNNPDSWLISITNCNYFNQSLITNAQITCLCWRHWSSCTGRTRDRIDHETCRRTTADCGSTCAEQLSCRKAPVATDMSDCRPPSWSSRWRRSSWPRHCRCSWCPGSWPGSGCGCSRASCDPEMGNCYLKKNQLPTTLPIASILSSLHYQLK